MNETEPEKIDYHISEGNPWTCPWCGKTYKTFTWAWQKENHYYLFGIDVCKSCLQKILRSALEKAKEEGKLIPPAED